MKFIRHGSLVPQYHDITDRWSMHVAPVEWGFYAFPIGFEEPFLLGGVGNGSVENGRRRFLRDENGNKVIFNSDDFRMDYNLKANKSHVIVSDRYKHLLKLNNVKDADMLCWGEELADEDDGTSYVMIENEPNRFEYNGLIWHHLDCHGDKEKLLCEPGEIIRYSADRSWVLTTMNTYKKCLEKYFKIKKVRSCMYNRTFSYRGQTFNEKPQIASTLFAGGIPKNYFSLDEFEVFIEDLDGKARKRKKPKKYRVKGKSKTKSDDEPSYFVKKSSMIDG